MNTAGVLFLCLVGAGCATAPTRTRPAEVAIRDFPATAPPPASTTPPGKASPEKKDDPKATPPPDASDAKGAMTPDSPQTTAAKLDAKNGFAGVTFGARTREVKSIKQTEKNGDRAAFRLTTDKTYAGVLLKDVTFTFQRGHLAAIGFGVKLSTDCHAMASALKTELGPAQKSSSSPTEAYVWKGDRVGLRFAIAASGGCGGVVLSKELSPTEWSGLEP